MNRAFNSLHGLTVFRGPLVWCAAFLSIANALGSAGKLPAASALSHQSAEVYGALVYYTGGLMCGCFLARSVESVTALTRQALIEWGAGIAALLSILCAMLTTENKCLPNALLGVVLGTTIISLRGALGSVGGQSTRNNLTMLSIILSGMPIFVPLMVMVAAFDLINAPYGVSAACCVFALITAVSNRIGTGTSRTGPANAGADAKRLACGATRWLTTLAILSLAAINTCVLVAILTLPIVGVRQAGCDMHTLLLAASAIWVITNTALLFLRTRMTLRMQLVIGIGFAATALASDVATLLTANLKLYLLAQVAVYMASMLLQATLFARIAQTDPLCTRAFGTQSGLQVGAATLVIAVASEHITSMTPAVGGQALVLAVSVACSLIVMKKWRRC